jgi:hypothetical protein
VVEKPIPFTISLNK